MASSAESAATANTNTAASGVAGSTGLPIRGATINITDTSANESATDAETKGDHGVAKESSAQPIWNSLKPGPAFTEALTPSATTPGATTPGYFSFDEPFDEPALRGVDPEALKAKIDHVHDGGLEGGFHHGDDHEDEDQ